MKEGTKPILIHAVHSSIIFVMMITTLVFAGCLGDIDDGERYTFFYRYGEYTFLYFFYALQYFIFLLLFAFGSLQTVPYVVMFWFKYRCNPRLGIKKLGLHLTVACFVIIAIQLGVIINFDTLGGLLELLPGYIFVSVIVLFILTTTYIIPQYYCPSKLPATEKSSRL